MSILINVMYYLVQLALSFFSSSCYHVILHSIDCIVSCQYSLYHSISFDMICHENRLCCIILLYTIVHHVNCIPLCDSKVFQFMVHDVILQHDISYWVICMFYHNISYDPMLFHNAVSEHGNSFKPYHVEIYISMLHYSSWFHHVVVYLAVSCL